MELPDRLSLANYRPASYVLVESGSQVKPETRLQRKMQSSEEPERWVIFRRSMVLNKDAKWVLARPRGQKSAQFLKSTRFPTPEAALAFWASHFDANGNRIKTK